ncbi:hypothetical protein TWF718_001445 [Orbilia javanica]|uniref:Uncharacterized protein n=1 Tax=Orbilia javanica TaxID=47235 RepID=A0AAN8RH25_9PEZI
MNRIVLVYVQNINLYTLPLPPPSRYRGKLSLYSSAQLCNISAHLKGQDVKATRVQLTQYPLQNPKRSFAHDKASTKEGFKKRREKRKEKKKNGRKERKITNYLQLSSIKIILQTTLFPFHILKRKKILKPMGAARSADTRHPRTHELSYFRLNIFPNQR